jgi:hypothetical protein
MMDDRSFGFISVGETAVYHFDGSGGGGRGRLHVITLVTLFWSHSTPCLLARHKLQAKT